MAKVLVVDDEKLLTDAYEIVLKKARHQVYIANDPNEGLELASKHKPDIILLDMLMPTMNGIEFMKQLKAKKISSRVYAFSNIENPEVVAAAKKMGVKDYLLKVDYTPHQVAQLVDSLMKHPV